MNTFTVTNTNDGGTGSLRQAILEANANPGADTIVFDNSVSGETIRLSIGSASARSAIAQLTITDDLTIAGLGADVIEIDAAGNSRVFNINDGNNANEINVTLAGLTITGGSAASDGGGISNRENLTLNDIIVAGNSAGDDGGGIQNSGTLAINNSTLADNSAADDGGAIENRGTLTFTDSTASSNSAGNDGGAIENRGILSLENSTISDNLADDNGGGIQNLASLTTSESTISGNLARNNGGGIQNSGTLTLSNSTLADNSADNHGGGIQNRANFTSNESTISGNLAGNKGGGIRNSGTLALNNSTVADNSADDDGGGIQNRASLISSESIISGNSSGDDGGGIQNNGTLTLDNSTISGNVAEDDGGGWENRGTVTSNSTTIADNSAGNNGGGWENRGTVISTNTTIANNSVGNNGDVYNLATVNLADRLSVSSPNPEDGVDNDNLNLREIAIANEDRLIGNPEQQLIEGVGVARGIDTAETFGILNNGEIVTDGNADEITGIATASGESGNALNQSALAFGYSEIDTINGDDNGFGEINTGTGDDTLRGDAEAIGSEDVGAFGVLVVDAKTDSGNDAVIGSASADGKGSTEARAISVGISDIDDDVLANPDGEPGLIPPQVGQLSTGEGDDTIAATANAIVEGEDGDGIFFAGANGIVVDSGTVEQLAELLAPRGIIFGGRNNNFDPTDPQDVATLESVFGQLDTNVLDTGAGNDQLTVEVTLSASAAAGAFTDDLEIIGDGIENAGEIRLGDGSDAINATVSVETTIPGAKALAEAVDNSSVGIIDETLGLPATDFTLFDLGAGDDTFTSNIFASAIDDLAAADGSGNRGIFVAGAGDDQFDLTSLSELSVAVPNAEEQQEAIADGWENRNQIFLDDREGTAAGNDTLTTNATTSGNGILTIAEGLETREFFDAGGGDDSIDLTATASSAAVNAVAVNPDNLTQAAGLQTEQVSSGRFFLDDQNGNFAGDDRLMGSGTATSVGENRGTIAFGITQVTAEAFDEDGQGLLDAGGGNDTLEGTAVAEGESDVDGFGLLFTNGVTGAGADTLNGDATAKGEAVANAIGIGVGVVDNELLPDESGQLRTDGGDDILIANANATADLATAFGIFVPSGSTLATGDGADEIEAVATATGTDTTAIGIFGGSITTGAGDDRVTASSDGAIAGSHGVTLAGGLGLGGDLALDLGEGDDVLTAFGTATIDGGDNDGDGDRLRFPFELTLFERGGGSITKNDGEALVEFAFGGELLTALDFEVFEFADVTFSFADLPDLA